MNPKWILLFFCGFLASAHGGETKSPPKGVSFFYFRQSNVAVNGEYSSAGVSKSIGMNARLSGATLSQLAPAASQLFAELEAIDPQLASDIDFGQINISAEPEVIHRVFGLGYGITDDLMVMGYLPYFDARVDLSGDFTQTGAVENAVRTLREAQGGSQSTAQVWSQVLSQFPQLSGSFLQSVIVHEMGYKPIGDWEGQGVGDAVLYAQYRFQQKENYRQAIRVGTTVPTGHEDDPDNLVDIPFGEGYWAPYVETVHDFFLLKGKLHLSFLGKLTLPLPDKKTYRLYSSSDVPLSSEKAELSYQPGWSANLGCVGEYFFTPEWSLWSSFSHTSRQADDIEGGGRDVSALESETEIEGNLFYLGAMFSTLDLYKKNKFSVPFSAGLYYAKTLYGDNTPDFDAYVLDFTMLF